AEKPIAAYIVPEAPQALAMLSRAGVPSFHTPEACADAIAAALRRRMPMALPAQRDCKTGIATIRATSFPPPLRGRDREGGPTDSESGTTPLPNPPPPPGRSRPSSTGYGGREQAESAATAVHSGTRLIDELEAYELLKKRGIACAPSLALDADLTAVP